MKKKEEVKRLKALKLKDLRARLEKIGKEGGKSLEDNKGLISVPPLSPSSHGSLQHCKNLTWTAIGILRRTTDKWHSYTRMMRMET